MTSHSSERKINQINIVIALCINIRLLGYNYFTFQCERFLVFISLKNLS